VREATAEDRGAIVEILAAGFDADPLFRWMFDGPEFEANLRGWLDMVIGVALGKGPAHIDEAAGAAAVWTGLGVPLASDEEMGQVAEFLRGRLGERGAGVLAALGQVGAHKPAEPESLQLVYIAVRPGSQGSGAGRALIEPVLADCDSNGHHAYLHATNAATFGFYERLGFEALASVQVEDGGPVVAPMWRRPR
jgi:ribosomal protein S18 acetylase RimI-like enzyme